MEVWASQSLQLRREQHFVAILAWFWQSRRKSNYKWLGRNSPSSSKRSNKRSPNPVVTQIKTFSISHSAPQQVGWGWARGLGGDMVRTAGPNWPKGYPIPYNTMLSITWDRGGVKGPQQLLLGDWLSIGLLVASDCLCVFFFFFSPPSLLFHSPLIYWIFFILTQGFFLLLIFSLPFSPDRSGWGVSN